MKWLAAAFVPFSLGCQLMPGAALPLRNCHPPLLSTTEIDGDLRFREQVWIEHGGERSSLLLAVEKRGDRLVVIGLSALGAKLFSAVQVGEDLDLDALPSVVLPVDPRGLLRALHAARFAADAAPAVESERYDVVAPSCAAQVSFVRAPS